MAMCASAHLTPVAAGATEWGFPTFNEAEHLCVTVPDHPFTITTKDSKGRTLTVHFGNYKTGEEGDNTPPTFVDIQAIGERRQDATGSMWKDGKATAFEVIGFAPAAAGGDPFDTRDMIGSPSLICIPLDGTETAAKSTAKRTKVYLDDAELAALYGAGKDCEGVSQALLDKLARGRATIASRS